MHRHMTSLFLSCLRPCLLVCMSHLKQKNSTVMKPQQNHWHSTDQSIWTVQQIFDNESRVHYIYHPSLRSDCPLNPTPDNHQPDIADINSLSSPLPFHCSVFNSTGSVSTCFSLPFSSHLFLMDFIFHSRIWCVFLNYLWLRTCVFKSFKQKIWKHGTF